MANDIPDIDTDDLILTIEHPMGRTETTLTQWIERGPGPRELVKPVAVTLPHYKSEFTPYGDPYALSK